MTARALFAEHRRRASDPALADPRSQGDRFVLGGVVTYLAIGLVIWGAALPDYLGAVDGVTKNGAPTGSLTYAVVTLVLSVALLYGCCAGTLSRAPRTVCWSDWVCPI